MKKLRDRFDPNCVLLLIVLTLLPFLSQAYDGNRPDEQSMEIKYCSGEDCFQVNRDNVRIVVSERSRPSQGLLCSLGAFNRSTEEIYRDVEAFCKNDFVGPGFKDRPLLANDALLLNAKNTFPETTQALSIVREILHDPRFYPTILLRHLSGYSILEKCGFLSGSKCYSKMRDELLENRNRLAMLANILGGSFDGSESSMQRCLNRIVEKNGFFSSVSEDSARIFCHKISELSPYEILHSVNTNDRLIEKLDQHLDQVKSDYQWLVTRGFNPRYLKDRAKEIRSGPLPVRLLEHGANASFEWTLIFKTIKFSPFFLSFLSENLGAEYLYFITAHEYGHALSFDREGLIDDFLKARTGGGDTFGYCSKIVLSVTDRDFHYTRVQSESIADYLAIGLIGNKMSRFKTRSQAENFILNVTSSTCSMFYAMGLKHLGIATQTDSRVDHRDLGGHALIFNRINALFADDRTRTALGCEPLAPSEGSCHVF